jgi:glycosyltransferase involved in cell wall biosynthesis
MLDVLKGYGVKSHAAVIPTGLEQHSFAAGDGVGFRRRYGIAPRREVLLYVGRVAHEKNIGFLLKMLEELRQHRPDVLLLITGEGPALHALQEEVARRQLKHNVSFIGYLDRMTELNDCYRAADVFVFSSLTETQGLVLLEAMAQGTPVVAIAAMGTSSILREGEGARIAPHDASGFAARVRELLADPKARQALGEAARAYARQWSARSMAERMLAFYRQQIRN